MYIFTPAQPFRSLLWLQNNWRICEPKVLLPQSLPPFLGYSHTGGRNSLCCWKPDTPLSPMGAARRVRTQQSASGQSDPRAPIGPADCSLEKVLAAVLSPRGWTSLPEGDLDPCCEKNKLHKYEHVSMLLKGVICSLLASQHPHPHFVDSFQVLISCIAHYLVVPALTKGWKDSGLKEKLGKRWEGTCGWALYQPGWGGDTDSENWMLLLPQETWPKRRREKEL